MFDDLPLLALSVRQPWAWALIYAGKHLENRTGHSISFMTAKLRPSPDARLAIHASIGMTRDEYEHAAMTIDEIVGHTGLRCPRPDELVRGAIIGAVRWRDIIRESTSRWFFGPKALVFDEPAPAGPIVVGGQLGLFEWRDSAAHCAKNGLTIDAPKPWMTAWPDEARARRPKPEAPAYIHAVAPAPLFDNAETQALPTPALPDQNADEVERAADAAAEAACDQENDYRKYISDEPEC